jgi:uncharacterized ferredoxin-like protein
MSTFLYEEYVDDIVLNVAKQMAVAAQTAPKAKGIDNIVIQIVTKDTIKRISEKLHSLADIHKLGFFHRDAENILQASVLFLIGTKIEPIGLPFCGLCGLNNCANKRKYADVPCAFNTGDLGIAIGSAVSIATNHRIDNRIMFSVGMAIKDLGLMGDEVKVIYGIPLSATSKNPFFDRKPKQ